MAVLPYRRHLRHSQRWSQLPSQLSSIGLRSAIRQDSQRPASTLPVTLRSPAVCCLCPLLYMGRLCGMDREREHLLRRNDNMLCPFGSELHILYLQDIQVATSGRSTLLAHYPERETPHRRHIGVDHSCRVRSTLYSVLGQSAKSAEWIFEGLNLLSPDYRHHLGWQQILRSFPRNRQREFWLARQTITPSQQQKCCHRSGQRTRQMAAFFHSQHQRPEKYVFSAATYSCMACRPASVILQTVLGLEPEPSVSFLI